MARALKLWPKGERRWFWVLALPGFRTLSLRSWFQEDANMSEDTRPKKLFVVDASSSRCEVVFDSCPELPCEPSLRDTLDRADAVVMNLLNFYFFSNLSEAWTLKFTIFTCHKQVILEILVWVYSRPSRAARRTWHQQAHQVMPIQRFCCAAALKNKLSPEFCQASNVIFMFTVVDVCSWQLKMGQYILVDDD